MKVTEINSGQSVVFTTYPTYDQLVEAITAKWYHAYDITYRLPGSNTQTVLTSQEQLDKYTPTKLDVILNGVEVGRDTLDINLFLLFNNTALIIEQPTLIKN